MGLFDSISKKMEENAEKRAKNKEIKQQEDAKYKEILNTFKQDGAPSFQNYYFDLKNGQILEARGVLNRNYRVIDFKDVLSYSINKKEHNDSKTQTKRKHALTRAAVGTLLGPVGTVAGALTSKKETTTISKDFVDHLGVVIHLNDGTMFEITYFNSTLKADNSLVRESINKVNELATILEAGIANAKKQLDAPQIETTKPAVEQSTPQPSPADPLDEIKKLKGLLDIGAITQEEFDAKKKQLLNL
ncbi:SHOCT domain-containing protein [uncultured Lactobacillus sp.]|uniref:SHOCT domain-containing protein n=1 Tax=uncultured Lactobacillus sp. TaxID=153152 RepID=UPI0027296746|nr:SHOCT domain-containing protein [uncultured Lactobacillus sp.]